MLRTYIINTISKVGLAASFVYTLLLTLFDASKIISAWPHFISRHINENALVLLTASTVIFMTIWMFSGKRRFESALTNFVIIFLTTVVHVDDIHFVFQLIPLLCISLGLALRYYPRIRVVAETKISIPKENGGVHKTDEHDQHIFVPENK